MFFYFIKNSIQNHGNIIKIQDIFLKIQNQNIESSSMQGWNDEIKKERKKLTVYY